MDADERRFKSDEITKQIIGCVYRVSNELGCGFVEKVYENALALELRKAGFRVAQQHPISVLYHSEVVGEFVADLVVADEIIVELKAAKQLNDIHYAQCMNYLKATGLAVCLLVNFGTPKAEVRRIVHQF